MNMKLKDMELLAEDRTQLLEIVEKGSDWRERHRAQTVLYFADGWRAKAIAECQKLDLDTVYDRRKNWLEEGFVSLPDKPRSGAPSKLSESHLAQIQAWVKEEALTGPALLAKLKEEFDVVVHASTLNLALKKMRIVWKRTRHSLKKTG
jgi:transposase